VTLDELNRLSLRDFLDLSQPLLEHCEWALPELAHSRPFSSIKEIQTKLSLIISLGSDEQKMLALCQHPKLGIGKAQPGFSQQEQVQAGLSQLTADEMALFTDLNNQYELKMGFPFVVAVTGMAKQSILELMQHRLQLTREEELPTAMQELTKIASLRVQKIF